MSTFFYHPKRRSFYHRSIIPRSLRPLLKGRVQYWRSLRTDDTDEAKARSAQWDARCQRVFITLKLKGSYKSQKESAPARYWLPLICLFEVTRREEAGQLAVSDIQEEDGISFIRINDDAKLGQALKKEGSRRRVPIHSAMERPDLLNTSKRSGRLVKHDCFPN
jgi:integrase